MSNNRLSDFLDGISMAAEALSGFIPKEPEPPILLTAEKLNEIRWMTEKQIETIYRHGKVPVKIDDNPKAYQQLRWMTPGQLKALFGEDCEP